MHHLHVAGAGAPKGSGAWRPTTGVAAPAASCSPLAGCWRMAVGVLSPASVAPGDGDTVVFDTAGMTLSADAASPVWCGWTCGAAGALDLRGHRLSLLNTAQLGDIGSRITGPGTLETDAISAVPSAAVNGVAVQLAGGATWSNGGLVMDAGIIALGVGAGDTATVINQPGALFALAIDQSGQIAAPSSGVLSFVNEGTLAKTAGTGVEQPERAGDQFRHHLRQQRHVGTGWRRGAGGHHRWRCRARCGLPAPILCCRQRHVRSPSPPVRSWATGANGDGGVVRAGHAGQIGSVQTHRRNSAQVVVGGGRHLDQRRHHPVTADLGFGAIGGDSGTLINQAGALLAFSRRQRDRHAGSRTALTAWSMPEP